MVNATLGRNMKKMLVSRWQKLHWTHFRVLPTGVASNLSHKGRTLYHWATGDSVAQVIGSTPVLLGERGFFFLRLINIFLQVKLCEWIFLGASWQYSRVWKHWYVMTCAAWLNETLFACMKRTFRDSHWLNGFQFPTGCFLASIISDWCMK